MSVGWSVGRSIGQSVGQSVGPSHFACLAFLGILRAGKFVFEHAPAQNNTAPAQIITAPTQIITAPAQIIIDIFSYLLDNDILNVSLHVIKKYCIRF